MGKRGTKKRLPAQVRAGQRPHAPRDLDPVAKAAWDSLCDDLESQGTLVKTDRKLIEMYAKTYSLWDRCFRQLGNEPLATPESVETEIEGKILSAVPDRRFINPLANLYLGLSQKLHRILLDCGLSPATRQPMPQTDTRWGGIFPKAGDGL